MNEAKSKDIEYWDGGICSGPQCLRCKLFEGKNFKASDSYQWTWYQEMFDHLLDHKRQKHELPEGLLQYCLDSMVAYMQNEVDHEVASVQARSSNKEA